MVLATVTKGRVEAQHLGFAEASPLKLPSSIRELTPELVKEMIAEEKDEHAFFAIGQVEDVRDWQWIELSRGSGLEAMTAAYFVTGKREHIHSVMYCSEQLLQSTPGETRLSGTRLVYRNSANPQAENPILDFTLDA